jgi:DHA1 family multidrug resistance protein-like MFS transporter
MKELIRDTVFGHGLRLITRGRVLQYEEDRDPSLWKRYIDKEKSGKMAHHGTTEDEEKEEEKEKDDESKSSGNDEERQPTAEQSAAETSRHSSDTRVGSPGVQRNEISGVKVDPEKGRDVSIVTWFSEDDPEVSIMLTQFRVILTKGRTR